MRYHFGYGVGHIYSHVAQQHVAAQTSVHEMARHDPLAPPASHTSNTPPAVDRFLREQSRQDVGQDVGSGLEAESSSESDSSLDLDDEDEDGAEVGEDLDFRHLDDIEELLVEEMYG